MGGNIGHPLIHLDEIENDDLVILELSSFQLEDMTISPHIAAVLNITPNHLDRHGTMEAYTAAKARILAFQNHGDIAILNREDHGSIWNEPVPGKDPLPPLDCLFLKPKQAATFIDDHQVCYSASMEKSIPLVDAADISLRGEHNLLNVLAACTIAKAAGFSPDAINTGISDFRRCRASAGIGSRI